MDTQGLARRYATADVTAADQRRLLLLVFEGGTRFLRLTRDALAAGDLVRFAEHLGRAQAIITELQGTLDHQVGGRIAADLARLYDFMLFHLTEANAQKCLRHVDEVLGIFSTIGDAYRAVLAPDSGAGAGAA